MDRNHLQQTVFPFLLPGLTKRKNCRHKNSILQHGYISELLTLKADTKYFLKTLRKKIRFENLDKRNLEKSSKATQITRSQDCNLIIYAENKII